MEKNFIYHLQASIGLYKIPYMQIFSTLDAALNRCHTLRDNYCPDTVITGAIYKLELRGETYEPVEKVCILN